MMSCGGEVEDYVPTICASPSPTPTLLARESDDDEEDVEEVPSPSYQGWTPTEIASPFHHGPTEVKDEVNPT